MIMIYILVFVYFLIYKSIIYSFYKNLVFYANRPSNNNDDNISNNASSTGNSGGNSCNIRHMPLPDIPRLSVLSFEALMCLFSIICLAAHYLNIYRTVFWQPHSHTRYAMVGMGLCRLG